MSDEIVCKQCGVADGYPAKCDGCDEMVPHESLVHYDGVGMFCPQATARLTAFRVPMFTLTVPASFANQFVRLCVQPGRGYDRGGELRASQGLGLGVWSTPTRRRVVFALSSSRFSS